MGWYANQMKRHLDGKAAQDIARDVKVALRPVVTRDRFVITVQQDVNISLSSMSAGVGVAPGSWVAVITDVETGRPQKVIRYFTYKGTYAAAERYVDKLVAGKRKVT